MFWLTIQSIVVVYCVELHFGCKMVVIWLVFVVVIDYQSVVDQ